MDQQRKDYLRRQYLKARATVSRRLDNTDCGLNLLMHISSDVSEACCTMSAIEAEVKAAMELEANPRY